jgi:transposase
MGMATRDARSMPQEAQAAIRLQAVKAYVEEGKTQGEVARMFNVTEQAVYLWHRRYQKGGWAALRVGKRGRRPGGGRLQPWQRAQIAKAVIDRTPDQLKLPFYLWTRGAVADLIRRRFGVRYSLMQVGRLLAHWGYTSQKPIRKAYEQDPKAVKQWLKTTYPAIRRRARIEGGTIHWGDEMGLRSDHTTGCSFGKRGVTPVVPGTGKRFGCNMISTITNRGKLRFMVFKERFGAPVFIDFATRLIKDVRRKVFLIVDRHPVHRSKKVWNWLRRHQDRIVMEYLPGYSPELNPDELLNQDVKSNAVGRRRPRTQTEMVHTVRGYLRGRQRQPKIVQALFQEKHVRYAASQKT